MQPRHLRFARSRSWARAGFEARQLAGEGVSSSHGRLHGTPATTSVEATTTSGLRALYFDERIDETKRQGAGFGERLAGS